MKSEYTFTTLFHIIFLIIFLTTIGKTLKYLEVLDC